MLREHLSDALKAAMKEKQTVAVATLRLILAALKDRDIAARSKGVSNGIEEDEILGMLQNMIKQRRDSIEMYEKGGRLELAEQEAALAESEQQLAEQHRQNEERSRTLEQDMEKLHDSRHELDQADSRIQQERAGLEAQQADLAEAKKGLLGERQRLGQEQEAIAQQHEAVNRDLDALRQKEGELADLASSLEQRRKELDEQQARLAETGSSWNARIREVHAARDRLIAFQDQLANELGNLSVPDEASLSPDGQGEQGADG